MTATTSRTGTTGEPGTTTRSLLSVQGLSVVRADNPQARIVDDVSFELAPGEALGLAGESGCGKTTTALSLLGLLPAGLRRSAGEIHLDTGQGVRELHRISPAAMRTVRWASASMVFQGAMNALDPVMRVGAQIREAILTHESALGRRGADQRVAELLDQVRIDPRRARDYPHEFSGGQRQRLMIALALACRPRLVIADEPTTALDVLTQKQILDLLAELRRELGLSLILITHDLSVLAETCDRIAVMYGGRIVESGPVGDVYREPQHPYTQRLLAAFPVVGGPRELPPAIPGVPPDPAAPAAPGCAFAPRCHRRRAEVCDTSVPRPAVLSPVHTAACHFAPWPAPEETVR
jgi:peptide/nickel transport system ATP-binding protein